MYFLINKVIHVYILAEKVSYDDGYWHRFLINSPEPSNYTAREIRLCPSPTISTQSLLVYIKESHTVVRDYTILPADIELIENEFDLFATLTKKLNKYDFFLG
jgi:hypothetical protein